MHYLLYSIISTWVSTTDSHCLAPRSNNLAKLKLD